MEQKASHPFVDGVLVGWHARADVRRGCPVVVIVIIIPIIFLYGFLSEILVQVVASLSSLERREQQWVRLEFSPGWTCWNVHVFFIKGGDFCKMRVLYNNSDKGKTWGEVKFWNF